jgi:hypothetical protein
LDWRKRNSEELSLDRGQWQKKKFTSMNLEQGSFLGEDDDEDVEGRPVESLMDCQESSNQHERMMSKASNETIGSYIFKLMICVWLQVVQRMKLDNHLKLS